MQTGTQPALRGQLQQLIDNKTKPLGALGRLEEIALQIGLIQGTTHPQLNRPYIVVFAGDHGIAATGLVNPYPQAVTAQMVLNFITGGAAINVFCRQHHLGLTVVDAGVKFDFEAGLFPGKLITQKIGYGTRNYLETEAMTADETAKAVELGKQVITELYAGGTNCIGFGEMGIGNTSSAALIMSYCTGIAVEDCVGRGTGVNDEQLLLKKQTLRKAYERHLAVITAQLDAMTILRCVGGFEIAMMVGAYQKATELKMVVLVDGFITTAALMLAKLLNPAVQDNCFFSHTSGESGHVAMLDHLGARPLLDLRMRLGEGTGAAMAYPLLQSAIHFLREMASFESAGVSKAASDE
ncbi:nicotinate-nucleotide--dimethylbenzimidazole phosphoribosyltransferase [Puia sp.]|jgi:nicotinate-nucleotide--dimethylbenzimidazole phosphoribosyltransferase|uniref:nicotinate-nucleotide--dimethylbenzimidazole phosphoribosyltransferase n=1 Tax=Puia sp. TaxID=2045100 RepID=UPI002F426493